MGGGGGGGRKGVSGGGKSTCRGLEEGACESCLVWPELGVGVEGLTGREKEEVKGGQRDRVNF